MVILLVGMVFVGCGEKKNNNVSVGQLDEPKSGEVVAEIQVRDYGVIKVKFFEEAAPKAVENFITHAKNGYYDGVTFHRIMDNFMIQGGDPTGTGRGGDSIWGGTFKDEFTSKLIPVRGAMCMANAGPNTNKSQFFIVQTNEYQDQFVEEFKKDKVPNDLIDYYMEQGGTGWLYKKHTVFGQVFEGMDIVDEIAAVEVDSQSSPFELVVIDTVLVYDFE